jgi:hypothetical protein
MYTLNRGRLLKEQREQLIAYCAAVGLLVGNFTETRTLNTEIILEVKVTCLRHRMKPSKTFLRKATYDQRQGDEPSRQC